jgi:hypothetical protein
MRKRRFFDSPSGLTVAKIVELMGAVCPDAARLSQSISESPVHPAKIGLPLV